MARFIPNMREINNLKKQPGVYVECVVAARQLQRFIRMLSPVDEGDYRDSWHIRPRAGSGVNLISSDYKAWWIEKGVRPHGAHPGYRARYVGQRALDLMRGN